MPSFYEFFAGGGMVRAALGSHWRCLFANDFDQKKVASYASNWGGGALHRGDVGKLSTRDLSGHADLAWASFPCQDLSLAGAGAGLRGERSGTFWPFWSLMRSLAEERRAPRVVVLENVLGTLSSHRGKDFAAIGSALVEGGYRFGAVVVDAVHFVPQSRPRLFIIAALKSMDIPDELVSWGPEDEWHPDKLVEAYSRLSADSQAAWIWWSLPTPPSMPNPLSDLIEEDPVGVKWHTPLETKRLLDMMSPRNRAKVEKAKSLSQRMVGTVYKRTRRDDAGNRVQRAEVRFDDVSGCLRTPAGGSSRQLILIVEGRRVKSRLISSREAARLMGLPDSYTLPQNYNEAYHLLGDGVAVPVVRFIAEHILEPVLAVTSTKKRAVA